VRYTYDWYRQFIGRLREADRPFCRFDEGIRDEGVLLRHDVDWSPRSALELARLEAEEGVTATYFVLVTGSFYNALEPLTRRVIEELVDLGHDVGIHFDVGVYFDREPNPDVFRRQVETDRAVLRERLEETIDTVAFHNPPEWVLNRQFEGVRHTYEPEVFESVAYRSDSLGRWRDEPPFPSGVPDRTQILVHPGLWGSEDLEPETRVRHAQEELLARADKSMDRNSRLEWSNASVKW
jgi:peptidoglycan/xylan/chitin deacetylase (PgdA/CDA1 family)